MNRFTTRAGRGWLLAGLGLMMFCGVQWAAWGQDDFRSTRPRGDHRGHNHGPNSIPNLSESTAILEAAVRNLYVNIEPGSETSPNELIAYADLRALRLYTGALEVAGWDLEQAAARYAELNNGQFSNRGRRSNNPQVEEARERYMAFRETVRTLLFRVRTTAVSVEHQVSFCDARTARQWQVEVAPALADTIAATQPLFITQDTFASYQVPGQNVTVNVSSTGIPSNAVEVGRLTAYRPYDGKGRGQGRYFEIRAFGGPVKVKSIRYVSHENSFGVIGTAIQREMTVDQIANPNQPLYIPCNRERLVDLSELEVEWESADGRRRTYGTIDVVADSTRAR